MEKVMGSFSLLLLIFIFQPTYSTYECIKHCACESRGDVVTANCDWSNFTSVPYPDIQTPQVNELYLQFNHINRLRIGDFVLFKFLRLLNMSENGLNHIDEYAFDGLQRLETLDLSGNLLSQIPDKAWTFVSSNLKWLSLANNAFFQISPATSNLTVLSYLDISDNAHLTDISSVLLPTTLENLDLHYTGIKRYTRSMFGHLKHLKKLSISDSMISSSIKFEPGLFDGLESLEFIDLSRTYCRNLPQDSFTKLKKLKALIMNNCYLIKPPLLYNPKSQNGSDVISNSTATAAPPKWDRWFNPELEMLDLSNNRKMVLNQVNQHFSPSLIELLIGYTDIGSIEGNIFNESVSIQTLDLSHARLRSIANDSFAKMTNLSDLDLSGNMLEDLPQLPQTLVKTDLSGLLVTNLTKTMLKNLHELRHITFANGQIRVIEDYAFSDMTMMEDLDLSNNNIRSLNKNIFYFTENVEGNDNTSQQTVSNLKALNLSANDISDIKEETFASLGQLETLDLQGNSLEVISTKMLAGLENLVQLKLFSNDIEDIAPGAFADLVKLQVLDLEDNSLEIIYENTFSEQRYLRRLILSKNRLTIMHGAHLPNLIYFDVSYNNLTVFPHIWGQSLETVKAAENSLSTFEPAESIDTINLKTVDFSGCKFEHFDYSIFAESSVLEIINLSENEVTNFVDVTLPNLKELHLSANMISTIDSPLKSILPALQHLDLSYNDFVNVNPELLSDVKLNYLDLSSNDLTCNCDIVALVHWMELHQDIVIGFQEYRCALPISFRNYTLSQGVDALNCAAPVTAKPSTTLIVLAAAVGTLLVVISIYTISVYVKARRRRSSNYARENGERIMNNDDEAVHVRSANERSLSLKFCCLERKSHRGSAESEDRRDLMISSPITSPIQKEAPASL